MAGGLLERGSAPRSSSCGACSGPPLSAAPPGASFTAAGKDAGLNDLYVSDDMRGRIVLLKNQGYVPDGTISTGINGPFDVTLDGAGNLYVANRTGGNVTEYAPGGSQPSFTYSNGMTQPLSVAVDGQETSTKATGQYTAIPTW